MVRKYLFNRYGCILDDHSMMTCSYKCLLSLLLAVMIMTKVVVPVVQCYKSATQSEIDQEEQKSSEENNAEKTDAEKAKTEVAELVTAHHSIEAQSASGSLYQSYFVNLLPSRYSAVPTPPPWHS